MFWKKRERRSPLKEAPLHYPGQSLDDELERIASEILAYGLIPVPIFAIAVYEWMEFYAKQPPRPMLPTVMTGGLALYSAMRIWSLIRKRRKIKLGRDGERAVGQLLENLHRQGFQVLHDVGNDRGNLDHILIGMNGIFTVETKMASKPEGRSQVEYDGERILIDGFEPDRNPIGQAKAQANWLRGVLKERTGRDFPVQPVVVYPGWYVAKQPSGVEVWVLNEKALPAFIEHRSPCLQQEDVSLVYACIAHYVRSRDESKRDDAGSGV